MKRITNILCTALCFLSISTCFPQTVREMMDANQKVYELVDDYIANANLTELYTQKSTTFRNLFESQDVVVYMDHIDWFNNANRKDTVSLTNYCNFYSQKQGSFKQFQISDVHIVYQNISNGVMRYAVDLNKRYSTINADLVENRLKLHISYEPSRKKAKITRIECTSADKRMQPHISANYLKYDNALYIPNSLKVMSVDGTEFLLNRQIRPLSAEMYARLSNNSCATYSYDFEAHSDTLPYHTISVSTVKNATGLELGYAQALGRVSAPTDDGRYFDPSPDYHEQLLHIGAVYQRQLFARDRHRLSLETGLSFDIDWQRLYIHTYQESREAVDLDGDTYTRLTTLSDIHEKSRNLEIALPVTLRYDWYVINNLSVFAAMGLRGSVLFLSPSTASFRGYYAGQYGPEFFNTFLDSNGLYDFGRFDIEGLRDGGQVTPRWHLDAMARVGVQYFLPTDNRWSMELSVGYRYRFLDKPQVQLDNIHDYCLSPNAETFNSALRHLTRRAPHFIESQIKVMYNF